MSAHQEKRADLGKMKNLATGLLVVVAVVYLVARQQGWHWVAAFAEAATIGALADWFAVVALFRHPLGLPIPHTAILPRNKARLADNLAEFIRDKFLDTRSLVGRVRDLNPAARLAVWLQQPANSTFVAGQAAGVLAESVDFLKDPRVQRVMVRGLRRRLASVDLSTGMGRLLDTLTEQGRHQALLDEGLKRLSGWLSDEGVQTSFAGMIVDVAQREYPAVVATMGLVGIDPNELGERIARGIVGGVNGLLAEVAADRDHPRRAAFDSLVAEYVERLKHDPAFRERVEAARLDLFASPELAGYLAGLWQDLEDWLCWDLARPHSRLKASMARALEALGRSLAENKAFGESLNEHLEQAVERFAPELREAMTGHVANTVRAWKDEDLVREVELSVGRDLQFIRLNGTLVGGLIGLALYAITQALG